MSWNDIMIPTKNELNQSHSKKIEESKTQFEINKNKLDDAINDLRKSIMTEIKDKLEKTIDNISYRNYANYQQIKILFASIYPKIHNHPLVIIDMFPVIYNYEMNKKLNRIDNIIFYIMQPIITKLKEHNYDIEVVKDGSYYYKITWG